MRNRSRPRSTGLAGRDSRIRGEPVSFFPRCKKKASVACQIEHRTPNPRVPAIRPTFFGKDDKFLPQPL